MTCQHTECRLELRGLLLQALGSKEGECHPEVYDYLLTDEDQLLLCTDGLTYMVAEVEIELILNSANSAKSACRSLVDLALKKGGRDNVTVIVAPYGAVQNAAADHVSGVDFTQFTNATA